MKRRRSLPFEEKSSPHDAAAILRSNSADRDQPDGVKGAFCAVEFYVCEPHGGTQPWPGSHDNHALGAPLCSGVERRWNRFARPAVSSWRVDKTYLKDPRQMGGLIPGGGWLGCTVDFRVSCKRDVGAAKAFFRKAIKSQGSTLRTIAMDGYAASHCAVREMKTGGQMPTDMKARSSKYVNNLIEQDHRGVPRPAIEGAPQANESGSLGYKGVTRAALN